MITIIIGVVLTIVAADAIGFDITIGVVISGSRSLSSLLEFTFPFSLSPFTCPLLSPQAPSDGASITQAPISLRLAFLRCY